MKNLICISIIVILLLQNSAYAQWQPCTLIYGSVNAIHFNNNYLFAGSNNIYRSTDYGLSWQLKNNGLTGDDFANIITVQNKTFTESTAGIFMTSDYGESWIPRQIPGVYSIQSLYNIDTIIYAGTGFGVYRTFDLGITWTKVLNGLPSNLSVSDFIHKDNLIFVSNWGDGIYKSTNNGNTWFQSNNGITDLSTTSLSISGNILYTGTWGGGIFISTNFGSSWMVSNTGLESRHINKIYVKNNIIFAGCTGSTNNKKGVYISKDNGFTWKQKNEGISPIQDIFCFEYKENIIYAGGQYRSVWKRLFDDIISVNNISNEIPVNSKLYQNYPNPFNPETNIKFDIAGQKSLVNISVFDIQGKMVEVILNEYLVPGTYEYKFNARNLSSGIYYYKLTSNGFNETKKLIILK